MDYECFAGVFALMGAGTNPNFNPVYTILLSEPTDVIKKIREACRARGITGLDKLEKLFKEADLNGNNFLDRDEFRWALKENGHSLTKVELDRIFRYFDRNGDNEVGYKEFM